MRKIVAGFAVSLDGYMEGPNGEYDWILMDPEMDFSEMSNRFDTFFIGRKTYEKAPSGGSNPFPHIKTYIFSNTLTEVNKSSYLISGDVQTQVLEMKEREGKDIAIWGGANLLASLLDLKLVDEISMSVIPVLLGQGKPMVDVLQNKVWLTLKETKTYSNGTIQLTYDVKTR